MEMVGEVLTYSVPEVGCKGAGGESGEGGEP